MNTIAFTQHGFDELKKEKEQLKLDRRAAVVDLKKARDMGDLSENGYYKAARFKLTSIDRRIRMVDMLLGNANVSKIVPKDTVDIGCTVMVDDGNTKKEYAMVGGYESDPAAGKLSIVSPLGKALQGKKKGEALEITAPNGKKHYTILNIIY